MRTLAVAAVLAATAILGVGAQTGAHSAGEAPTLQERIDQAAPEDIIVVEGGTFHERITINKPVSLIGRGWPVIDGGGQGDVVTITADDAVISGFEVRNSSKSISTEPAAIKVSDADRVSIKNNRVRDAYFAVHMTGSDSSTVADNDIHAGAGVDEGRRGHALYLWEVHNSQIHRNRIREAADGIHLEFANDNLIVENTVTGSRYALHFMYSHKNTIVRNTFTGNLAGAVLMFSHDLVVKDNEFSQNREGATGAGMLLKDNDNLFAEGNRMLRNKYGMTVEGTPQTKGTTAVFRRNLFALNDVGIALTSNSPITFVENAAIDNGVQVKALSGAIAGQALAGHGGSLPARGPGDDDEQARLPAGAVFTSNGRGNYWSDYRGYDADGDGVGDQPYLPRPAFAGKLDDDDTLRLFQFTPAQQAIDLAADLFPIFRYHAVIEDQGPLMSPPEGLGVPHGEGVNVRLLAASGVLLLVSASATLWLSGADARNAWRAAGGRVRPSEIS